MANDWKKTLRKCAETFVCYGIPAFISWYVEYHPVVMTVTVGTILKAVADYLRHGEIIEFFKK